MSWGHPGEHCGGRLMISADNYLYCTTAEYNFAGDTIGNINGRVLRINLDGTVPSINVSGGYSISKGHRNPQGIIETPNGNIIISELGQIVDELNLITETSNYGWPAFDGENDCFFTDSCNSSTFQFQLPIDTAVRPPSGITYYDHPAIPEFQGCILQSILSFGGYQGGLVASKLNVAMNDIVSDVHYFKGEYFRFRDVCSSPDGKVFVITNDRQFPVIRCISNLNYYSGMGTYENSKFKIYPNPASTTINIEAIKTIDSWEMFQADGKIVSTGIVATKSFQLDISNLASGVYFLKMDQGIKKFIKQ